VHLVGFIIRIYHDARSAECQIDNLLFMIISNQANSGVIFNQLKTQCLLYELPFELEQNTKAYGEVRYISTNSESLH
jgi:hypothetical protein